MARFRYMFFFGLVGAVGSCLGGSVLVGRLSGVVAFGDIDP